MIFSYKMAIMNEIVNEIVISIIFNLIKIQFDIIGSLNMFELTPYYFPILFL